MSPGSCGRINTAKLLDYLDRLDLWKGFVEAACGISDEQ